MMNFEKNQRKLAKIILLVSLSTLLIVECGHIIRKPSHRNRPDDSNVCDGLYCRNNECSIEEDMFGQYWVADCRQCEYTNCCTGPRELVCGHSIHKEMYEEDSSY